MLKSAILLILTAIAAAVPLQAQTCMPDLAFGGYDCVEYLTDTHFSKDRQCWSYSTNGAAPGTRGTAKVADLFSNGGRVSQQITIGTNPYDDTTLGFDFWATATTAGTERLYVEIINGTVPETLLVLYPNSSQTYYTLRPANDYTGDTITVRFRYAGGVAPGDTKFQIDNAAYWTSN